MAIGTLPIEITGVVSNHETHRRLTEWYGLPFHHYPIEEGRKVEQEARILQLFETTRSDLLVLARYMQVLSDEACRSLSGRCINIHHSFLPGFGGGNTRRMRAASRSSARDGALCATTSTKSIIEQDVQRGPPMLPDDLVDRPRPRSCRVEPRGVLAREQASVTDNARSCCILTGDRTATPCQYAQHPAGREDCSGARR